MSQIAVMPRPCRVVEAAHQSREVADPVSVGVHEGADGQAVDDPVLVPEVVDREPRLARGGARGMAAPHSFHIVLQPHCGHCAHLSSHAKQAGCRTTTAPRSGRRGPRFHATLLMGHRLPGLARGRPLEGITGSRRPDSSTHRRRPGRGPRPQPPFRCAIPLVARRLLPYPVEDHTMSESDGGRGTVRHRGSGSARADGGGTRAAGGGRRRRDRVRRRTYRCGGGGGAGTQTHCHAWRTPSP